MAGDLGELRGTIEPNGNHVWNGSEIIEDLTDSLESQIGDRWSTAGSIDIGLVMDSQVFSLVISISQTISQMTKKRHQD